MFKAGDTASYGTSGVCTIAEQKRVTLGGQPHDCFILKPVYDASMKICVPCDSAPLLERMRPLPTRDDLLALLREPLPDHDPDPDARKLAYREALKSGTRWCAWCGISAPNKPCAAPRASSFPPMRTAPCATPRTSCTVSSPMSWA